MFVNRREVQIQWGDCDPANIVYYPRYFAMFDDSTSTLFEVAGFSKQDLVHKYGLVGIPMRCEGDRCSALRGEIGKETACGIYAVRPEVCRTCMYFIAAGAVEVDLPGKKVQLGEGAFFGEMALLGNNKRGANVSTTKVSRLLVLDLVDFRVLMARHPDLAETIDAEAKRRALENK